jgi:poly-gamma-glutamate synthesis protein (capsule biosynthesis protein)
MMNLNKLVLVNNTGRLLASIIIIGFQLINPTTICSQETKMSGLNQLKLLFIGDIMGHDTQIASALNAETGRYDYSSVFRYIAPILNDHDITIANLEVTLAGEPYKGYPQFSSPAALAVAANDAGIDILVTANNHSVDRGLDGLTNTIYRLDSLGIPHLGTYYNSAARDTLVPHIIDRNGIRLALLNYTYGTNGIRVPAPAIVDLIDRDAIEKDILKAKSSNSDGIIVFIHWGTEYDTLPGHYQVDLAEWMMEKGVTMVIGSHPHVIQPMELRGDSTGNRLVVYSMGNFISNQRNRRNDGGVMVSVNISKSEDGLLIEEAGYILTWVYTPIVNEKRKFFILPASTFEADQIFPADIDAKNRMRIFIDDSRKLLGNHNKGVWEHK